MRSYLGSCSSYRGKLTPMSKTMFAVAVETRDGYRTIKVAAPEHGIPLKDRFLEVIQTALTETIKREYGTASISCPVSRAAFISSKMHLFKVCHLDIIDHSSHKSAKGLRTPVPDLIPQDDIAIKKIWDEVHFNLNHVNITSDEIIAAADNIFSCDQKLAC